VSLEPNFCIIVKYANQSFYHYAMSIVLFKARVNNNSGVVRIRMGIVGLASYTHPA
jgi:hypothetical protein